MGRSNRKEASHWTETHPDRDMWSPGRLAIARSQTLEEYETLYGRGSAGDAHYLRSPLFPDPVARGTDLRQRAKIWQTVDKERLAEMTARELLQDPVFSFWAREDYQNIRAQGLSISRQQIQKSWANRVLEAGWPVPTSALAAILGKEIPWDDWTEQISLWKKENQDSYQQFFRDTVWPNIGFFLTHPDPDQRRARTRFMEKVYQQLRQEQGGTGPDAVLGYRFLHGHMLRANAGPAFERHPLLQEDCGAAEAVLGRFFGDREQSLDIKEGDVFADQVARILVWGKNEVEGEDHFRQALKEFAEGHGDNPLANLEPLLLSRYGDLHAAMQSSASNAFWRAEARRGELLSHLYYALHRNRLEIDHLAEDLDSALRRVLQL